MNKRKSTRKQNIINLLLVFGVIILINYLAIFLYFRIDLTAEKRHTLTPYTKGMLKHLNADIYVKIYLSGDDLPPQFKRMQKSLKELLDEFKIYSDDNIEYEFINPTENTDKKVRFGIYKQLYEKGIIPFETNQVVEGKTTNTMIFPSAIITYTAVIKREGMKDTTILREIGLNFLKNDPHYAPDSEENINISIQAMEYEITNALVKLGTLRKPAIAFIEGHGELEEQNVADISTLLSEYYDVRRGAINGKDDILNKFAAIIIAKPVKKFEEKDKYIIDQYIMNGGKVLWLIDGCSIDIDSLMNLPSTLALPNSINLDDQLFKYGARINPNLVQDLYCAPIGLTTGMKGQSPKIELFPWYYYPVLVTANNHTITKYLDVIKTEFPSSVDTVGTSPDIKRTILLTTSKFSRTEVSPAMISFASIQAKPDESQFHAQTIPVAVLLEGSFESLYKNRSLNNVTSNKETFKDKSKSTRMIVVSDGDIIKNEVAANGEILPLGFDRSMKKLAYKGNAEFLLNAVNYLCDNDGLMSLRNREIKMRLLDKDKVKFRRNFWQVINIAVPVFFIVMFGIIVYYIRRRKYSGIKQ